MSETACRSGAAKLKTEADATAIFPVRPRRARVTGLCNVRWSRTLNPWLLPFSMGGFLYGRFLPPRLATIAHLTKDSWNQRCAGRVVVDNRLVVVTAVLFEWVPVVPPLASWNGAASLAWLNPTLRGSSEQRSGAIPRCRRCRAKWRGWFDTRLCALATQ